MNELIVDIYTKSEDLPPLLEGNFFHSREYFCIVESSPGNVPYMVVATDRQGHPLGQLLVVLHRRSSLLPPYLYTHAHAYGEGQYTAGADEGEVFRSMLSAITQKLTRRLCLYVEFSNLSKKMFAYRHFRKLGYFPVAWQEVHNSLHSMEPQERLSAKTASAIQKGNHRGVAYHEITEEGDIVAFHRLLKKFYRFKLRRYIPPVEYFEQLSHSSHAKMFATTYKGLLIGGCACVFSQGNAYLWYIASRRKTFAPLHPDAMTVWHAIQYAHDQACRHIYFIDVGLPWHHNRFRSFILGFGGKPVAKYRWFRFHSRTINRLLKWIYENR